MRIALLTAEYPPQPGGIGDYTAHLGAALAARGHQVLVFTITDFGFWILDLSQDRSNPKSKIANRISSWGWRSWGAVRSALARTQTDILHIEYQTGAYGMHPAINFLPLRLKMLRKRPRVAVTAHDLLEPYLFPKAGPVRGWVTRRLLADADAAIVTNETDFEQVLGDRRLDIGDLRRGRLWPRTHGLSPALIPIGNNIAVAPPPGYDRAAWRAHLGATDDMVLVAYFGLISHTKGLDVLLGALAHLPPHVHLLVVGGAASAPEDRAYAERIQRQIAEQGLAPRITITGQRPAAEVSADLLAADLAALPYSDGASFRRGSLLAALAHGLPTVTTQPQELGAENQAPSSRRLASSSQLTIPRLVDGEHALLVKPGDAEALASAIARLAHDAELRARLASGGRALAEQFGWPAIAERHEALYAQLLLNNK